MNGNNDVDWQKLVEWPEGENTYLIHLVANEHKLSIEIEDKFNGEIWCSQYTSEGIEQFTDKAKNKKKYSVFIHMVKLAIQRSKQTLKLEILSYKELSLRFGRTAAQLKNIPQQQASKRFFLLSYISDVEKMQFPLPVVHLSAPDSDRLRLTIRRLAQENSLLRQGSQEGQNLKEINMLRYENQTLKSRLKSMNKPESYLSSPKIQQIQRELHQKQLIIQKLTKKSQAIQSQNESLNETIKNQEQKMKQYEKQLKQKMGHADKRGHKQKEYEGKLQMLIGQMRQLTQQLQFARQNEKKSSIKIKTLERQLQNMIANKKGKYPSRLDRRDSSPQSINGARSLSVKSKNSNKSNKSNQNVLKNTNKNFNINNKKLSNKKSSVYDSDTESSRLRKMNTGRSPFRQSTSTVSRNKKTSKPINDKSRSKSKEQMTSPQVHNVTSSQMYTEEEYYQSDDSEERLERLERKGQDLKHRKQKQNPSKVVLKGNSGRKMNSSSQSGNHIQNRFQVLEQMIKKAAQSTKTKN